MSGVTRHFTNYMLHLFMQIHVIIGMLQIIKNQQNFKTEIDWLTSYHHFSFGEHYHPERIDFGPLRVFNDDTIKAGRGFDFHPHNNMEIVTFVIDGTLEHKDSMGNVGVIESGEVQRMT